MEINIDRATGQKVGTEQIIEKSTKYLEMETLFTRSQSQSWWRDKTKTEQLSVHHRHAKFSSG